MPYREHLFLSRDRDSDDCAWNYFVYDAVLVIIANLVVMCYEGLLRLFSSYPYSYAK